MPNERAEETARYKRMVIKKHELTALEHADCYPEADIVVFTVSVHKRKKHVVIEPTLKKERTGNHSK